MDVALFDYELPAASIAQEPATPRDAARLLVLDRAAGGPRHARVRDLPELLRAGDLLVLNDTRVVPARLFARKPTGGAVELLLLERLDTSAPGETWLALVGASRAPRPHVALELPDGYRAELLEPTDDEGRARVAVAGPGPVAELLERRGLPPLPPYIRRAPGDPRLAADRERYQTVYAREPGAVAAPTAGLHFTPELLDRLAARGVERAALTLHVGEGTFRPVRAPDTADVRLHEESFTVPEATAAAIAAARGRGGRVVAVGTTVARALESRPDGPRGAPLPGAGRTSLFIAPGFAFRHVDALLTNFHLPRSTLLMLVAAFAGRERVLAAYREAVAAGYRFYSYGDAMLAL
ncbi:MAG: tRNA preQ1(34) S-adenosylmethionine ribosyltransferase-isomerase QueA [Acidobacteria bacterium]|nr:tRNA preQ1(34) S-adenosylmethionine ribosyltransferase-isomerase QueA [Acidobacteriota bacterium]